MRRIIAISLVAAGAFGLAGCGQTSDAAPADAGAGTTEIVPVEGEAAAVPVTDTAAAATDPAAPAPVEGAPPAEAGPDGIAPSSSTGGRVTPP